MLAVSSNMNRRPFSPSTLVISWGSVIAPVTPFSSNTFTISRGDSMELSKCTWASMSPGVRYRPVTSISCRPLYWPIPTILLPLMATSATSHVFKNTLNTFPPFNTRSASCRPMAVSICSSKVVARQKSMFCTCFPIKMNYARNDFSFYFFAGSFPNHFS